MTQISSLQKGLIFHAPLDSWNGTRDLISGAIGTPTDVYPVVGRRGEGRRWYELDGVNDYVDLGDKDRYTLPSTAFSITARIKTKSLSAIQVILSKDNVTNREYNFRINTSGYLYIILFDSGTATNVSTYTATTLPLSTNTEYSIGFTFSSGTGTLYVNGVACSTTKTNIGSGFSVFGNTTASLKIGAYIGSDLPFNGSIRTIRIFNRALTLADVVYYGNPSNPIKAADRSGNCLLDLNPAGMTATTWEDLTNSLTTTVSGASLVIPPSSNLKGYEFNGVSSKVEYTGMNAGSTDITLVGRIKAISFGEGGAGRLFDNTKIMAYVNSSGYLTFTRNGSTAVNSAAASIAIDTWYHIAITSTAAGVSNLYINGVLSGTANQVSGTPASGTTWEIGNNAAGSATFEGVIDDVMLYGRILSQEEITTLASL